MDPVYQILLLSLLPGYIMIMGSIYLLSIGKSNIPDTVKKKSKNKNRSR